MASDPWTPEAVGMPPGGHALRGVVAGDGVGVGWLSFRRTLAPRYLVGWAQVALSYVMLLGGLALAVWVGRWGLWVGVLSSPLFAVWFGYWLHPLMLFGHEAAHFNFAADRATNDRLANIFLMSPLGLDVKLYRKIHWQHHLHLGDRHDTEVSYRERPSLWFLTQTFLGISVMRKVIDYRASALGADDGTELEQGSETPPANARRWRIALLRTAALHLSILGALLLWGRVGAALAWTAGVGVFFPAFNMLRQILEHRSAEPGDSPASGPGAVNRMFPGGPISGTFGGAGFNRHLLHHWDPTISYTCFDEMEAFLMRTEVATAIDDARTTYAGALRMLMAGPR